MIVIASGRMTGRTTAAATWLLGGREVDGWPGWSRFLVVATAVRRAVCSAPEVDAALRAAGAAGGLGKLVVTVDELREAHGLDPAAEFALDDAETVLAQVLGWRRPALLTITGVAATPRDIIEKRLACCDLHDRNCEPPSELCCWACSEAAHPGHADGSACSNPDLSANTSGR